MLNFCSKMSATEFPYIDIYKRINKRARRKYSQYV